ncbi:capsule assembly Wzi family protein [Fibrella forsythiae]|uniref:Capsule assembly Wzi family protein n=1 Tax=Fibrella forsythiae TaxID=2817061 RepID=A0ABS3JGX0_9BACT|nr:capsule assembly Wzi family protein [Fibrella forsythiae]MBO0949257.1 capsule assembly Wzi family protein [Fibrella forsythiae]
MKQYSFINLIFFVITTPLSAQSPALRTPNYYHSEAGAILSTSSKTPYWLRTNQYGSVPYNAPSATIKIGFLSDYDTTRHKFDIAYGADLIVNGSTNVDFSPTQVVLLQQAYIKAKLGILEAYVGRRREVFGLDDTLLTSGSYSWSGNALPVPKIQIGIPRYTPIGFTKGWVSVMGTFAHGWLGGTYVQHAFLHQKSLFFRIGKVQNTFRAYGGVNHDVVWGGVSPELVGTGIVTSERLPASFRDYLLVVSGLRTGSQTIIPISNDLTDFDITNRIGNHLGSIDIALEVDLRRHSLFIYRQNPFDSGALFYLTSIADGLNGIRLRNHAPNALFQNILFEFLNTTSQGGPEFILEDPQRRGKVNYFNNAQFRDGWAYQRQTIGTPFITPNYDVNGRTSFNGYTINNRIYAWHLGASGTLPNHARWLKQRPSYLAKLSLSRNLGTYDTPYPQPLTQFSMLVQVSAVVQSQGSIGSLLDGTELIGKLAIDAGGLYPSATGFYLGIRRSWQK